MSDKYPQNSTKKQFGSKWGDLVICLILLALSTVFMIEARKFSDAELASAIGPATFPTIIAVLLIISTLGILIPALIQIIKRTSGKHIQLKRPVAIMAGLGLFVVFPFAMDYVGYFPAAAIWLILFGLTAGIRKPLHLLILTGGFLLFAWVVFNNFLNTPL